jgi:aryl-alcohol dehydrogenase-like predicted oxidoreductase
VLTKKAPPDENSTRYFRSSVHRFCAFVFFSHRSFRICGRQATQYPHRRNDYVWGSKVESPLELLNAAHEKRFRRYDLARTHGARESERLFGEWLEASGIDRNSVEIITKGGMGKDKYGSPDRPMLTFEGLRA